MNTHPGIREGAQINGHLVPDHILRPALYRLFGELSDDDWSKLAAFMTHLELPGGHFLFRQGEVGDAMYIVINGRLQVLAEDEKKGSRIIAEIGRGETVGEMALITGDNRVATVCAIRDCNLIRISKDDFEKFFAICPAIGLNLARLIIQRFVKKKPARGFRGITNIAIVTLHGSLDQMGLALDLQNLIKDRKKILLITSEIVDEALGPGASQSSLAQGEMNKKLSMWLDKQEAENEQLIYVTDPKATEWTRRCIRQADEILLIADASFDPELTPLEEQLLEGRNIVSNARQTLILVQPDGGGIPKGTGRWLNCRPQVKFHLHLRRDNFEKDAGRIVRYLTDTMIGLVLAGGGAKGFAHIGVWRALNEMGIPVDAIGGTSMGAFLGGAMAFDWSYEKVFEICRDITSQRLNDINLLPIVSLLKGKVLNRVLEKYYLPYEIEDCLLTFYCISSNMTRAVPNVHRRGNLFKAIRASGSLPGIVPPIIEKDGFLVDGGIFNNFPTDEMIGMGVGTVIGVDFTVDRNEVVDPDHVPSSLAFIMNWLRLSKKKPDVPTFLGTIIQSTTLYSAFKGKQTREMTDIYINPNVARYGLLEWGSYEEIVQAGYERAIQVFENHPLQGLSSRGVLP